MLQLDHPQKKLATRSPTDNSNAFSTLNSFDEEVEMLILKAQQMRKTIHPRLLGTSGRDIKPGGGPALHLPSSTP